jgi:CubicO group peptidase (beta-lactamase class C family)
MGHEFGLQVGFVDSDPTEDGKLSQGGAMWHPELGTTADTTRSHPVRLSHRAGDPQLAGVSEDGYRTNRDYYVDVEGATELIGKAVELRAGGEVVGKAVLEAGESGWAFASPQFRTRPWRQSFKAVDVFVEGRQIATVTLPEAKRRCAEMLVHHEMKPDGAILTGPRFPRLDFEEPETIEGIIGPYELTATFYDADYNEVTTAQRPGRYGAIVEVTPRNRRQFKRFVTLYRTANRPDEEEWRAWRHSSAVTVTLPPWMGIDEKTAAAHSDMLEDFARGQLHDGLERYQRSAVMLAGLFEASAEANVDPDDTYSDPRQRDRAWWLGLKRKLYGWDKRWPEPFVCPRPIEGEPAPVVREGTLAEAGMKPDAREKLNELFVEWSENTNEAFAVCVVRRGVIVVHEAHGTRDGKPMTVDTKSWMASITKMLSGTLIMMLVDQGLMDLDDPIQDYLPGLADLETNEPLTIRRLYNHSDDLDWHFGSGSNDMEERMTPLLPLLKVGREYRYNGTGMELTCKALEAISGETLPAFYKSHLLDPLGCENTDIGSASHDAHSVPLEMAKIGQMLMQKGAYGDKRFFSEATFEQMLPKPVIVNGEPGNQQYGVGTVWTGHDGLSPSTFSHGAASSATMWMDPANELVIIMTRNDAGENFYQYHTQFAQLVIDSMIDPTPAAE